MPPHFTPETAQRMDFMRQDNGACAVHIERRSNVRDGLFDHLVGAGEQRWRYGEAKRPGGFEIYRQVEFCR